MASRKKSAATLPKPQQGNESKPTDHVHQGQARPSASTIFSTTIQDLEGLLNEALNIARVAAEKHEEDTHMTSSELVEVPAQQHDGNLREVTGDTESISVRELPMLSCRSPLSPSNSLNAVDRKRLQTQNFIKPCGPAHRGGLQTKSSVAQPQLSYVLEHDWAQPFHRRRSLQQKAEDQTLAAPDPAAVGLEEPLDHLLRHKASKESLLHQDHASSKAKRQSWPPVLPRSTSKQPKQSQSRGSPGPGIEHDKSLTNNEPANLGTDPSPVSDVNTVDRFKEMFGLESSHDSNQEVWRKQSKHIELNGCRHVDVKGSHDFNVHDTWRHQPIARDWEISRKRFAATIACINTSLIGIIIGIYAGEVPAIQYIIVDLGHSTILGNVVLYLGLAIPTLLLWPLPLMHGRKPYTVMALAVALCLQIPQGIAVSDVRSPYVSGYRRILLLSRGLSGFALGFVNINLQATLLDLFGASLQSGNPHQEVVDLYDVRRHGGGMGLWLGLWSWCYVGSISIGFFIGTLVVENADVTWGFWISLMLVMMVLLLNVIGPEVRRSAYRRTVAEVMGDKGHINRVSRGEVKMHLKSAGPYWWGEEVKAGMELCWKMLQQPGFAVLAVYIGWAYAHFTLVLMVCSYMPRVFFCSQNIAFGSIDLSLLSLQTCPCRLVRAGTWNRGAPCNSFPESFLLQSCKAP